MFENIEKDIRERIPQYEGIVDVVIENPAEKAGIMPCYSKNTPVIRLLNSTDVVFIVMANRRPKYSEDFRVSDKPSGYTYDYYRVPVSGYGSTREIQKIEKLVVK
jgi:hypothetical protein